MIEENYGEKAKSLIELKEKGLFNKNLVVLSKLKPFDEFKKLLEDSGMKNGDDIAVRFSSPNKNINLPRSIVLNSFEKAYDFMMKNINDDIFSIIQDFIFPEFSGTLIKKQSRIYLSVTNGAWEQESSQTCDNILIENNRMIIWFLPNEKECLFVDKERLIKKKIKNNENEIKELMLLINNKIENLNFEEETLYEFAITPEKEFVIMEFKRADNFVEPLFSEDYVDIIEINGLKDLDKWDKEKNLLISVPVSREDDLELFKVIEIIKPYKNEVFINYGLCSHPAIVLREAGINTIPYTQNKKMIEVELK